MSRKIRAPRGTTLTCKSWLTEAPFRMIQNNLDPDVSNVDVEQTVEVLFRYRLERN